jgi:hypothetical protein
METLIHRLKPPCLLCPSPSFFGGPWRCEATWFDLATTALPYALGSGAPLA